MKMKTKVIHVISSMQLGGVEKGINLSIKELSDVFNYKVLTLTNNNTFYNENDSNHFLFSKKKFVVFSLLSSLLQLKKEQPDFIVSSLWKSVAFSIIYKKFVNKKVKLIAFIHSEKYFHLFDKIFTNLILKYADVIAFDSNNTLKVLKAKNRLTQNLFIIPYIFNNQKQVSNEVSNLPIKFLFAGRLDGIKNLSAVLDFLSVFKQTQNEFIFHIYGEGKSSYLYHLKQRINLLNLSENISFKGSFGANETSKIYSQYHFYIQFSKNEGMAMSIVDAMIHGIIPIATPVGEIKNYITHLQNGILIEHNLNDENYKVLAQTIMDLYNNFQEFSRLKNNASNYFSNQKNYIQSFKEMIDTLNR